MEKFVLTHSLGSMAPASGRTAVKPHTSKHAKGTKLIEAGMPVPFMLCLIKGSAKVEWIPGGPKAVQKTFAVDTSYEKTSCAIIGAQAYFGAKRSKHTYVVTEDAAVVVLDSERLIQMDKDGSIHYAVRDLTINSEISAPLMETVCTSLDILEDKQVISALLLNPDAAAALLARHVIFSLMKRRADRVSPPSVIIRT